MGIMCVTQSGIIIAICVYVLNINLPELYLKLSEGFLTWYYSSFSSLMKYLLSMHRVRN